MWGGRKGATSVLIACFAVDLASMACCAFDFALIAWCAVPFASVAGCAAQCSFALRFIAPGLPTLRLTHSCPAFPAQGLLKSEGKQRFGDAYSAWSKRPAEFTIDGHAPVRELWYRASLAWQQASVCGRFCVCSAI